MAHAMIHGEPEWIKLTEAIRRYDVAIGYVEPPIQFILKSHGVGLLHNAIREEMSERLTKSGASSQLRFKGTSSLEAALTDIPTEYFRVARTFTFENEIFPYADKQTMEEWADSRNHGNRHPTWIDVVVHGTIFGEWLRDATSDCLRPSTCDPAVLPDKQSLTLAETTGFLAFGLPLEGSHLSDWCDPTHHERKRLIELCRKETEGTRELSHWPSNLQADAKLLASNLFVEITPKPWPPSADKLYELAVNQAPKDELNSQRFAVADALIHYWAFNGKLKISGVKENSTEREEIDHLSFETRYELDWWFGNLISPPLFENDGRFAWSKVFVERHSLALILEKYANGRQAPLTDPASGIQPARQARRKTIRKLYQKDKVEAFFAARISLFKPGDLPPTIPDDQLAAEAKFPNIDREQVRECRRDAYGKSSYAESWTKPGPRETIREPRAARKFSI